jgi:hypothetical protein
MTSTSSRTSLVFYFKICEPRDNSIYPNICEGDDKWGARYWPQQQQQQEVQQPPDKDIVRQMVFKFDKKEQDWTTDLEFFSGVLYKKLKQHVSNLTFVACKYSTDNRVEGQIHFSKGVAFKTARSAFIKKANIDTVFLYKTDVKNGISLVLEDAFGKHPGYVK